MNECSGVLIVDKPAGMTSHDAVNIMRKLYNTKKVGHTGTLDPMATGVLVILIGRAAKAAEYLVSDEKKYEAGLLLGKKYDTGDITGNLTEESSDIPEKEKVLSCIGSFKGKGQQIPPMYSALKVDGQKLVNLARKGIEVERKPRDIEIYSIDAAGDGKEYKLKVHCSKGTYMRTLCEDIGEKLSCPSTMSSLRRTASGGFDIKNSYTIDALREMDDETKEKILLPTESLFEELPIVKLPDFFVRLSRSGQQVYQKKIGCKYELGRRVRLYDNNGFYGLGEVSDYPEGSAIKTIKQFVL
ncbi:MAG: tRNA pseudouridine(55) synthase TruB [Ruminococcaceae bacterium]|nr:tRNA pseudouridine(55) synthase TruB [Oscillospiraceae bacterium]